ncbi:GST [Symbiodinium sp. KB8]|nr:GST [Symbiodinium sp. KB8]
MAAWQSAQVLQSSSPEVPLAEWDNPSQIRRGTYVLVCLLLYMDVQQYMGKYTRNDWMKFQQQQNQQQQVPYSASDCKTPEELEAWKQRTVLDNVDQEYKKNSERLGMAPPSDSASAESASSGAAASGSKVEADPDVEKALAKARAALAQSSSVESPKALLETDLKQDSKDDQKTKILQPPLATELAAAAPLEEPTWHPYRALGVVLLGLALPAALALFGLGSRPLSPCVSRRNSEDSITIERYIELDAGDEVYLASATPGAPAQYAGYQADYKTYEDYKKEMESAGKGAMNYTAFTKAYEKYQQFMDYLHKVESFHAWSLFSAPTGDLTGFQASCSMDCFCGAPPAVMKSYKLVYFDARGVAETCRLLFAAAKQPYEDVRLSLTFGKPGDFSTISRPEFDDMKAKGDLDVSLGKVPLLEVDGKKIGQSKAIERYLAADFGMMGGSSVEAAQVDMLGETIRDIKEAYQKAKDVKEEEKAAALEKWFKEDLPDWVKKAEKSIPPGSGPFLVGGKISLADLQWYMLLLSPNGFFDNTEGAKASFQDCPKMKAALLAVDTVPQLQEYIAKRKNTMF